MASRREDIPALESSSPSGFLSAISSPIGMIRRNTSYDDTLYGPMHSPPGDFSGSILWNDPVIPKNRFRNQAEDEKSGEFLTFEAPSRPKSPLPVVKATSLLTSLKIKQIHDVNKFEQQTGLTNTAYTPHRGLSAEETQSYRMGDGSIPSCGRKGIRRKRCAKLMCESN